MRCPNKNKIIPVNTQRGPKAVINGWAKKIYLILILILLPLPSFAGGSFFQTDWRGGIPSNTSECSIAGGSWSGSECLAAHPDNQLKWDAYADKSTEIIIINEGGDIESTTLLNSTGHTLTLDFAINEDRSRTESLNSDFSTNTSQVGTLVLGDSVVLNSSGPSTGTWVRNNDWNFLPEPSYSWPRFAPATGDLDGDGHLDLLVGNGIGSITGFRNDGANNWIKTTTWDLPQPQSGYTDSIPALGDLDGDGDLDLIVGYHIYNRGSGWAYRNNDINLNAGGTDSTLGTPVWARHTAWDIGTASSLYVNLAPTLGDMDGDSDLDVIWCARTFCRGLRNDDVENDGIRDGFIYGALVANWSIPYSSYGTPALADLDNDGDLDAMVGSSNGKAYRYENIGGGGVIWNALPDGDASDVGQQTKVSFIDLDGDNDLDMLMGEYYTLYGFENVAPYNPSGTYTSSIIDTGINAGFTTLDFATTTPTNTTLTLKIRAGNHATDTNDSSWGSWITITNSGDSASALGYKRYVQYEASLTTNNGSVTPSLDSITLHFLQYPTSNNTDISQDKVALQIANKTPSWSLNSAWYVTHNISAGSWPNIAPELADLDGDNDMDLMVGDLMGNVHAYENDGSNNWTAISAWDVPRATSSDNSAIPALGDLDGDGDLDMIVSHSSGSYGNAFGYRNDDLNTNVGGSDNTLGTPVWTRNTAWDFFSNWTNGYMNLAAKLADFDGDGDLDVTWCYSTSVCRTTINNDIENDGMLNGFIFGAFVNDWDPGSRNGGVPATGDFIGDNEPDILMGGSNNFAALLAYENIGGTGNIWLSNAEGYVAGLNQRSYPTLADLDGDNDLDIMFGNNASFIYALINDQTTTYELTGTYTSAVININNGIHAGLDSIDYTLNTAGTATIQLDVRAGNSPYPDDGSWSAWVNNISSGGDISALGTSGYVQYRTTYNSPVPSSDQAELLDITINYKVYPASPFILSSAYDTGDNSNIFESLSWTMETLSADYVSIQIRTAPDSAGSPGAWTNFIGPDGTNSSYWSRTNTHSGGCTGTTVLSCNTIPALISDGANDRWFQYRITMGSLGDTTPTFSDIEIDYKSTTPAITVSPIDGLETSENAGQASFNVVLDTQPSSNVNIHLWSSDTTEGDIDKSDLTFTNANWDTPQTVTVTGANDGLTDGLVAYTIHTDPATGNAAYSGVNANDVRIKNHDNEAGVATAFYSETNLITHEASSDVRHTSSIYISLTKQPLPTTTVTLFLNNGDTTEGSLSTSSLSFNDSNWSTPQQVVVTAVDDFRVDGNIGYTITIPTITGSGDPAYDGYNPADISVINLDDDVAGITLAHSGNLTTTESGGMDNFTIVLDSEPTASVTINLSTDDTTEGIPLTFRTTFTLLNWNVPKSIAVRGLDETEIDGDVVYNVTFPTVTSGDLDYNNYSLSNLPVTNIDDDAASITVTPTSNLVTTSKGGQAAFSVVLDYATTDTVTIPVSSDNINEGTVSTPQLIFNSSDWSIPQYVTITGNNNAPGNDPISYNAVLGAATSFGPYSGIDPTDVNITNILAEPAFIVTPSEGLIIREGASAITFDVSLATPPTVQIDVSVKATDTTEIGVSPAILYFNASTWATPQTVTISAPEDVDLDGPILSYIDIYGVRDPSASPYKGMKKSIPIITADNDSPSVAITRGELFTSELGGSTTLSVALGQAPTGNVNITLTSSDTSEGAPTTNPTILTFTTANYFIAKAVTIVGANDSLVDGDVSYSIDISTSSSDNNYNLMSVDPVEIINLDNEAGLTVTPRRTMQTSESGGIEIISISLNQQPTHDVQFSLSTDNLFEGTIMPYTMTFTPGNWNTPQYASLFGINDGVTDSDVEYNYIASNFSSSDSNFDNLGSFNFPALNMDVTSYFIDIRPTLTNNVLMNESGGSHAITIKLGSRPTADITIPLSVTDTTEAYVPASVTIPSTGYGWQSTTFTVTALDDTVLDSDQAFQLIISPFESADTNYDGYDPTDVNFVTRDNEQNQQKISGGSSDGLGIAFSPGDFNGDGNSDLAIGGNDTTDGTPNIYYGDGSGNFPATADHSITDSEWHIRGTGQFVTGNFNGDQYDDLVIKTNGLFYRAAKIAVYLGEANGFTNRHFFIESSVTDGEFSSVATARLNNDNYDDLIVGIEGTTTGRIAVFYGSASGLLTSATLETNAHWILDGAAGEKIGDHVDAIDMDGDGYDDIITTSTASTNSFIFYSNNNGSGMATTPQQTIITAGYVPSDMEVGDINNDGTPDLLLSNITSGINNIGQVHGFHGPFTKGVTVTTYDWLIEGTKTNGYFGSSISLLGDTNGDGYSDLFVGAYEDDDTVGNKWGSTRLYLGNINDMSTTPHASYYPDSLARHGYIVGSIGDTDGDGKIEFASGGYKDNSSAGALYLYEIETPPSPAIITTPSSGLITSESGGTDSFIVALSTQPISNVTLSLSTNNGEGSVSPSEITLTQLDWRGTNVTITGQDDNVKDGPTGYSINITASSSDNSYNNLATTVTAINIDNDTPGIIVTPTSGLTTAETASTADFSIVLTSPPSSGVDINLSSSQPDEGLPTTNTLTFTDANWSIPQSVSIVGQDDLIADGDISYTITTSASSLDSDYNNMPVDNVSLINLDNDALPNVTVTATTAEVTENAGSGTFSITRSGSTVAALTVFYSLSGSATEGSDYPAAIGNISIPIGESKASFNITPSTDILQENAETVIISLLSNTFYIVNTPASATITIIDDNSITAPSANFSSNQVAAEGTVVTVQIILSGTPAEYPVTIPFTIKGTATQILDHTALNGNIVISAGVIGEYSLGIVDDGIADAGETIIFSMGTPIASDTAMPPVIALVGVKNSHTITIIEYTNVAPAVELSSVQNENTSRLIVTSSGGVTITATVTDPNVSNTHTYDWSETNNTLVDIPNSHPDNFIFNPTGIADGFYNVALTVTDNGNPSLSTRVELLLEIATTAPILTAIDSDGDGITDDIESYDDSDGDGIPNYLDNNNLTSNELQILGGDSDNYVMSTEPGLNLHLGDVAFAAGSGSALITEADIALYGDGEGGAPSASANDNVPNTGGYFDFEVTGLTSAGQSINIVIPRLAPLPFNSVYRKYDATLGWRDYVEDANNAIYSAQGTPGECPAPGSAQYSSGLSSGDYCVQLLIEDGGPNDTDGIANNVIEDPAQIVQIQSPVISGRSGGGALSSSGLLILSLFSLAAIHRRRVKHY